MRPETMPVRAGEGMPYVEYDEVQAICSDCGRVFRSEEDLAEHQAEAHSGQEKAPIPATTVRCSLCKKMFHSTAALRTHNAHEHTG